MKSPSEIAASMRHDEGVSPSSGSAARGRGGRKADPFVTHCLDILKAAIPGKHSFFFPDAKSADLKFLRKPCQREGVGIMIREVECDEIYKVPGVRLFRTEGEYDEL